MVGICCRERRGTLGRAVRAFRSGNCGREVLDGLFSVGDTKALGLAVPPSIMLRADEAIE